MSLLPDMIGRRSAAAKALILAAGTALGCGVPPCHAHRGGGADAGTEQDAEGPVICPGISSFSINPALLALGQPAQVTILTLGPVPTILWSVSPEFGGQFADAGAPDTTFQCASGGQMTVSVQVGVPDSGICDGVPFTSYHAFITCVGSGIVCFPPTANCGGMCVDIALDPNNCGSCNVSCSADQTCSQGSCIPRLH